MATTTIHRTTSFKAAAHRKHLLARQASITALVTAFTASAAALDQSLQVIERAIKASIVSALSKAGVNVLSDKECKGVQTLIRNVHKHAKNHLVNLYRSCLEQYLEEETLPALKGKSGCEYSLEFLQQWENFERVCRGCRKLGLRGGDIEVMESQCFGDKLALWKRQR